MSAVPPPVGSSKEALASWAAAHPGTVFALVLAGLVLAAGIAVGIYFLVKHLASPSPSPPPQPPPLPDVPVSLEPDARWFYSMGSVDGANGRTIEGSLVLDGQVVEPGLQTKADLDRYPLQFPAGHPVSTQPLLQLPNYYKEQPGYPQQHPTTPTTSNVATAISPTAAYRALTSEFTNHGSFTAPCSLCGQQVTPLACGVVVPMDDGEAASPLAASPLAAGEEHVVCVACLEQKQESFQRSTRCTMSKKRALTWLRYHGAQMQGPCVVCEDPECRLELLGDDWQCAHLTAYATGVARGDLEQLAPTHARCNSGQGTRTLSQYQQEIGVVATLEPFSLREAKELYARLVGR